MKKIFRFNIIILLLISTRLLADITPYAGMQMGYGSELREKRMYNPLGFFGIKYEDTGYDFYVKHLSSIPNQNDGIGMNYIGGNKYFEKIWRIEPYVGLAYAPDAYNKYRYAKIFDNVIPMAGARIKSGDKYFFVETMEGKMFTFGIELDF